MAPPRLPAGRGFLFACGFMLYYPSPLTRNVTPEGNSLLWVIAAVESAEFRDELQRIKPGPRVKRRCTVVTFLWH